MMVHVSYLHARLGGQEEPERAPDRLDRTGSRQTQQQAHPLRGAELVTIRCRTEVTELHAANLVSDIAVAAARAQIIIIDLSLTARIDAAGLGALVSGAKSCRDAGSGLHIVGAHGIVAQALRFTGLSRALSTHATVEDALRALGH